MSRIVLNEEVIDSSLGILYPDNMWLNCKVVKGEYIVINPYNPQYSIRVEESNIKTFIK